MQQLIVCLLLFLVFDFQTSLAQDEKSSDRQLYYNVDNPEEIDSIRRLLCDSSINWSPVNGIARKKEILRVYVPNLSIKKRGTSQGAIHGISSLSAGFSAPRDYMGNAASVQINHAWEFCDRLRIGTGADGRFAPNYTSLGGNVNVATYFSGSSSRSMYIEFSGGAAAGYPVDSVAYANPIFQGGGFFGSRFALSGSVGVFCKLGIELSQLFDVRNNNSSKLNTNFAVSFGFDFYAKPKKTLLVGSD